MGRLVQPVIHWAARCAAVLVAGSFLLLLAGEFFSPYAGLPTKLREWAGIVLLLAAIIGMLAAWKWELPGALLSLLTLGAFVKVAGMHRYGVVVFAATPGMLFLADCLLRHRRSAIKTV